MGIDVVSKRVLRERMDRALGTIGIVLLENDDVTITPNISPRKLKNAIRSYGANLATANNVRLLIDNTVLRSGKEGLMLTGTHVLCKTGPSGKLSIALNEVHSVEIDTLSIGPVPIFGIRVNDEHFIALPGLVRTPETVDHPSLVSLIVLFNIILGFTTID
jgi:hypothetical protein